MRVPEYRQKIKHHFYEVISFKKSPQSIAMGFAIGTFISILPTPGFNILLGILVVLIYHKVNKFSLFGAMAVWNPVTVVPIYMLSYTIGDVFYGNAVVPGYDIMVLDQLYTLSAKFLVGNIFLALAISASCYIIVGWVATVYQARRGRL